MKPSAGLLTRVSFISLIFVQLCGPNFGTAQGTEDLLLRDALEIPAGFYELEEEITFNVLDQVVFNPTNGQITLIGHNDETYLSPRIPYLQHLAVLLENP